MIKLRKRYNRPGTVLFYALSCLALAMTLAVGGFFVYTLALRTSYRAMALEINDAFLAAFDKDAEDYSLTVSSAGLDQPFKVPGQYTKAIGSQVVVLLKGGRKLTGILTGASDDGISLRYTSKEAIEGKKKKVTVEREENLAFSEINSVTPKVEFKK